MRTFCPLDADIILPNLVISFFCEFTHGTLRFTWELTNNFSTRAKAMRQAAQCAGRVIRNKNDYGIVIFADKRFSRAKLRSKLPKWIAQFLTTEALDLNIGSTMLEARAFLLDMAQPTPAKSRFESPEPADYETIDLTSRGAGSNGKFPVT